MRPMSHADHQDDRVGLMQLEKHSVVPPPGRAKPVQRCGERLAEALGTLRQHRSDELDDGDHNFRWQPGEVPLGPSAELDPPRLSRHRGGSPY